MTRGVVYIATREPYLTEATTSARSVREHHPTLPITLYTCDTPNSGVFDTVEYVDHPNHDFSDSNLTQEHIHYDRTLFLDTDTYVTGSLDPVFDVLDRAQLAAAQDPTRTGTAAHTHEHDVPDTFPQYNTGVLAFRDTKNVRRLFDRWNTLYNELDGIGYGLNQPTFRMALYESDTTVATLPPEYNFRIGNVANSVAYACGPVRILHGRSMYWHIADLAGRINETHDRRVIIAKPGSVEIIENDERTPAQEALFGIDRAHWAYQKYGAVSFAKTLGALAKRKVVG